MAAEVMGGRRQPEKRQFAGNYNVSNFVRRAYHNFVLGDFLYIDGGGFVQYENGRNPLYLLNETLAIDLRKVWNNATVQFIGTRTPHPRLMNQIFWPQNDQKTVFVWGGSEVDNCNFWWNCDAKASPTALANTWRFEADGAGGVIWTMLEDPSPFKRKIDALTVTAEGIGYAMGGLDNFDSGAVASLGMITYNMEKNTWSNGTVPCYDSPCSIHRGAAHFLPDFGKDGILLSLGGATDRFIGTGNDATDLEDFGTIHIFDLADQKWLTQATSGDIPEKRVNHCVVGLPGDEQTYEIFLYGGHLGDHYTADEQLGLDAVFVLSLPGFVWKKAAYTPTQSRYLHTCNVVGKRQMVVVGGVWGPGGWFDLHENPRDPWPSGLNIFDLSDMRWRRSYDPDLSPYTSPIAVKAWYRQNGRYPAVWDGPEVRALITDTKADAGPSPPSHKSVPGRMIGGLVGGVVGLCIIAALGWFLMRHRRPGQETPTPQVQVEVEDGRQRGSEGFDQKAELHGIQVPRNGLFERSELGITRTEPVIARTEPVVARTEPLLAGAHDGSLAGPRFHALPGQLASQDMTRDNRHELL